MRVPEDIRELLTKGAPGLVVNQAGLATPIQDGIAGRLRIRSKCEGFTLTNASARS